MQCLAGCLTFFRRNEHNVEHAKSIRNNFLNCWEKINVFLNVLMIFLGFIMIITGIAFISNDLWEDAQFQMKQIKRAAIAVIVCYLFIVPSFGCLGVMIVRNRSCHTALLAIWGTLIFFCLSIPLMTIGSGYLVLDNVSSDTLREACGKDMT